MASCDREVHITGLYQWSKHSDKKFSTDKKSMLVTKNFNGTYNIILKEKIVSDHGDKIDSILDSVAVIHTKIKYGKIITAYTDTTDNRYKLQFIFQRNSVKWRYAKIESLTKDVDFVKEKISHKKYYKLKVYDK